MHSGSNFTNERKADIGKVHVLLFPLSCLAHELLECRSVKGRMSRWTTEEFLSDFKSSSWSVGRRQFKKARDI